jgi:hypothetical protein
MTAIVSIAVVSSLEIRMPNPDERNPLHTPTSLFGTHELTSVSRERKHACIKRELRFRREVFPRRVAAKTMTQSQADEEIAVMNAILADYAEKD